MIAKWRLLYDPPQPGEINMRRDQEILAEVAAAAAPPTLRLYSWAPPALSLGRFQKAEEVADVQACRRLGIDIVRRPTGGRAVLHDRELTYSLAIPDRRSLVPAGVVPAYRFISGALLDAFARLGVEAQLSSEKSQGAGLAPGSCFDSPSAYELHVRGKKVVGSAQMRREGMLLQHGSILMELPIQAYRQILRFQPRHYYHEGLPASGYPEYQAGAGFNGHRPVASFTGDHSGRRPVPCHPERSEGSCFCPQDVYLENLGHSAAGLLDLGYNIGKDELAAALAASFARLFDIEWIKQH